MTILIMVSGPEKNWDGLHPLMFGKALEGPFPLAFERSDWRTGPTKALKRYGPLATLQRLNLVGIFVACQKEVMMRP